MTPAGFANGRIQPETRSLDRIGRSRSPNSRRWVAATATSSASFVTSCQLTTIRISSTATRDVKVMLTLDDVIERNPKKVSGTCVFRSSRLPVMTLFNNLEAGLSIDDFLYHYEGIARRYIDMCCCRRTARGSLPSSRPTAQGIARPPRHSRPWKKRKHPNERVLAWFVNFLSFADSA
ncbi:MAG: DUF433 domain-containing protein [Gammaproteobacteria bacterium]|nr:DUF433 domain-containing protein [Gammaproteobacteria bacterium]MYF66226.1 DUF433 domain-containing protein [Gammaproteobacteria bacterium]MYK38233.1 DUF433 domain-containing protein [Gammaproteobacteria bacterium]